MSKKAIKKPSGKSPRLEDLSEPVRGLVENKRIWGRRTVKEWLQLLTEASSFDVVLEQIRNRAGKFRNLFIAATVILAIVAIFVHEPLLLWLVLVLAALGAGLFFGLRKWNLDKQDVSDDFRKVLVPLLRLLQEDIHPYGQVHLRLDIGGLTKEKVLAERNMPPGRFKKVVLATYADHWCRMKAPLANGGELLLSVENIWSRERRRWRNANGKFKWKTKWKKVVRVTAGLIPDSRFVFDKILAEAVAKRYRAAAPQEGEEAAGKGMRKFRFRMVRVRGREIGKLTRKFKFRGVNEQPQDTVTPQQVAGMFFQMAGMLRPTGRRSQAS